MAAMAPLPPSRPPPPKGPPPKPPSSRPPPRRPPPPPPRPPPARVNSNGSPRPPPARANSNGSPRLPPVAMTKPCGKRLAEENDSYIQTRPIKERKVFVPMVLNDVDVYKKQRQVGQGTYGSVFVGAHKKSGEVVALKRINTEQEENGFPITALREVKILKALKHQNIVNLKEIVTSKGTYSYFLSSNFLSVDIPVPAILMHVV